MRKLRHGDALALGLCVLMWFSPAAAEDAVPPASDAAAAATVQEAPRLVPYLDYGGNLLDRPALTGDWNGSRQNLMEKGVRFDFSLTQIFQRNVSGGVRNRWAAPGRFDFSIQLDTGKLGWWPGGLIYMRGMAGYGNSSNMDTGALLSVDTTSLYPHPTDDAIALTDFYVMQFLSESFGIMVGKFCSRDTNVFAHDETTQFMNTAFVFNPVMGTTVPLSFLGAGILWKPVKPLTISVLALDSEGEATSSGFDTVFHRGTSVFGMAELDVYPFGLPGHQRIGGTWSDKSRTQFQQDWRTIIGSIIQGQSPVLARRSDDWCFLYDFDQYVYLVPGSKDRGLGVFGRIGFSDGKVNPIEAFYSVGVGGKGMIRGREKDTFGVGYYYLAVSDKLPRVLKARVDDEQGVEMYYNFEVTPWLHITPDLQIINPVQKSLDTAVVFGVRVKMDF